MGDNDTGVVWPYLVQDWTGLSVASSPVNESIVHGMYEPVKAQWKPSPAGEKHLDWSARAPVY